MNSNLDFLLAFVALLLLVMYWILNIYVFVARDRLWHLHMVESNRYLGMCKIGMYNADRAVELLRQLGDSENMFMEMCIIDRIFDVLAGNVEDHLEKAKFHLNAAEGLYGRRR